ncbi:hypothetical protein OTB20_19440 [Streptomyces sp. H27-H1]|uniref:hypothetical protein n=1 Tax=Streptomyces sp. H27-H1 TaxID=2996461 RepID=UPI002271DC9F|nr:hypothetical protein [Streptomyces sp. H27-H1]MCY0928331.1 hypothetical protein [Streptomyces sp. H27-H1]
MAVRTKQARTAAQQARTAAFWGDRRKQAAQQGPAAEYAAAADQLRATIARLPESERPAATRKAVQLLDDLRQSLADQ